MRIHLKKRFTALMLAGMMVTSNVLPAYSATDGIAVEQADASYEADAAAADASVDAENSEAGGASSEQGDAGKPVVDDTDSTTDASANAGTGSGVADAAAGEQTTANKSEATDGAATEESKADAANDTVTEESKSDVANGAETEESKSDAAHGTGAEESKADAGHGSHAGGSSVVGAGSVDIDESTGAAVEIEETKPAELLEEETKLATESEIPKEEDEKTLEEKENRKTIYIAFGKGVKVTATLEDANAVPDDARLRVTEIDDDEMYAAYLEAMDEAEPETKHTKENTDLRDIAFIMKDEDGEETEYEPTEGSVKVAIEYLGNNLKKRLGVEDIAEVKTYHLRLAEGVKAEGEKTIDVQNVKASDINVQKLDGEVKTKKKVEVELDSFSVTATVSEGEETFIDLNTAVTSASILKVNGSDYNPTMEVPRNANIEFSMNYAFDDDGLKPTATGIRKAVYSLPKGLNITDATTGSISCEGYTDGPAGTYEIKDHKVYFTYDEEFLRKKPNGIKGTFSFTSTLSQEITENKELVEINFGGSGSTTKLEIKLDKGNVSGYKKCDVNADGTVDFEIVLTVSGKTVENVVLNDEQGSNLEFVKPLQFTLDGETFDSSKISETGNNKVRLNLGSMAIGEHKLCYKARLKDRTKRSWDDNKNLANWTWDGGNNSASTSATIKEKELKKTGWPDNANNEINWTVIYIPGTFGSVAGKAFVDTLGKDQKYTGKYEVYYDPNGTIDGVGGTRIAVGNLPENQNTFTYTFPENRTEVKGGYKIVYKTKVAKNITGQKETFTNKIEGDGKTASDSATIDHTSPHVNIVTKSGVANSDDRKATWTLTITPPEGKEVRELVINDELQDCYNWEGKFLQDTIVIKEGESNLSRGRDYTLSFETPEPKAGNAKMIVTFLKPLTAKTIITYQSDYGNTKKTGWVDNKFSASYLIDGETQTDNGKVGVEFKKTDFTLNKTGELSGRTANWKIAINNAIDGNRTELKDEVKTIVDTIPEGMEYVEGSLKCKISLWHGDSLKEHKDVITKFDKQTRKLTININNLDIKQNRYVYIELEYQTKIVKFPTESGEGTTVDGDKISFTNEVKVGKMTDSATVTIDSTVLDKKGKQKSGVTNVVEYSISVNQEALDLAPEGDELELKDELDTDLILDTDPDNVSVTDMHTGKPVPYKAFFGTTDEGKNTLKLTIPDGKALLVSYRASLVTAGKVENQEYQVSNNASLNGRIPKSTAISTPVKYEKTNATIVGASNSIKIKKVDASGKELSGADFVVREVDPSTLKDKTGGLNITTVDGIAEFNDLSFNTLYYYQETKAPDNYRIKDNSKHYFILKNSDTVTLNTLVGNIKPGTKYAVLSGGNTFIVENEKIVGSLKLMKEIKDTKDNPINDEKTYQFIVKKGKKFVTKDGDLSDEPVTIPVKSGEPTVIENLDLGTYTVSEKLTDTTENDLVNNIDGYTFKNASATQTVEIKADDAGTPENESIVKVTLTNTYKKILTKITINKKKVGGTEFLPNAKLQLFKGSEKVAEWTTANVGRSVEVKPGTYTLHEESAPNGYKKASDITFSVDEAGKIKIGEKEVTAITMIDEYSDHHVTINKQKVGGELLPGAKLQLFKGSEQIAEWTTENAGRSVEVKPGIYRLHEDSAPSGYKKASDITFSVDEAGKITSDGKEVTEITMIDDYSDHTVTINKQKVGGELLPGAKLQLFKGSEQIAEWTTADAGCSVEVKPGTYTLHEDSAPNGYKKASDITFSVDEAGKIKIGEKEVTEITMIDEYSDHHVTISKTDAGDSELEGAVLELTDATGARVDQWKSTTTARTFELKPGTYKLHEVSAPSGYLVADDITFTVAIDGTITVDGKTVDKVVMIDGKKPEETTVPETTPAETTPSGGGGGGGDHPHPLPETTPAETTPAETTVPETTPVETTAPETNPGGGNGGHHGPSEEVETDEFGNVLGANRGRNKKGQDGGNVKGASRGKTRTGDESMMSIFGFGFLAAVLVLLGWFGIRFTKRNRR